MCLVLKLLPNLLILSMYCGPACGGAGVGASWSLRPPPIPAILWFILWLDPFQLLWQHGNSCFRVTVFPVTLQFVFQIKLSADLWSYYQIHETSFIIELFIETYLKLNLGWLKIAIFKSHNVACHVKANTKDSSEHTKIQGRLHHEILYTDCSLTI